jgi:hypothetical protein
MWVISARYLQYHKTAHFRWTALPFNSTSERSHISDRRLASRHHPNKNEKQRPCSGVLSRAYLAPFGDDRDFVIGGGGGGRQLGGG